MHPPVGISHYAVHEVVVHEPEAGDRWAQVQVYHMLPGHPPQVLGMAHPCQGVNDLIVTRQFVAIPARAHPRCSPGVPTPWERLASLFCMLKGPGDLSDPDHASMP